MEEKQKQVQDLVDSVLKLWESQDWQLSEEMRGLRDIRKWEGKFFKKVTHRTSQYIYVEGLHFYYNNSDIFRKGYNGEDRNVFVKWEEVEHVNDIVSIHRYEYVPYCMFWWHSNEFEEVTEEEYFENLYSALEELGFDRNVKKTLKRSMDSLDFLNDVMKVLLANLYMRTITGRGIGDFEILETFEKLEGEEKFNYGISQSKLLLVKVENGLLQ